MVRLRVIAAGLAVSAPVAVAAVVMGTAGWLSPWPAVALWAVSVLGAAALLYRPLVDLRAVARQLLHMPADQAEIPAQLGHTAGGDELAAALRHVNRQLAQASEQVERTDRLSDQVFHALPDPTFLLDRRRRITRANAAAVDLFGANMIGRDLAEVVRNPALLEAVDLVLERGGRRAAEMSMVAPVERFFQCHVVATDEIGAEASVLIALKDFTDMRRTEKMRVDFIANASHEIRTPLATLSGFIETLQGPAHDDPEAQQHFLELMAQQATRMTTLVSDLLSLSRIEMNEHTPPTASVDVALLLNRARALLASAGEAAKADIVIDAAPSLPAVVGDDSQLEQVFQNLLINAVRYAGGRIEVTARRIAKMPPHGPPGPAVAVEVRDSGPGIPAEHLSRLTERFYRVDTGRSRELGGTGLGLAIVKHIVNRHRGILTVESELGEGSTFTVYLPLAGPETNQ